MRINVIFNEASKTLKIPVVISTPHKRVRSDFVIDTGSPHTVINYIDSMRLNIPHNTKGELIRVAGRTYQSYVFDKISLIMKSLEGELTNEEIEVRVLKPSSSRMNEIEELDRFPNLLGMDFLEKFKFVCDLPNKEVFLEKK